MPEPRASRRLRALGLAVALGVVAGVVAALVHGTGTRAASSAPRPLRAQIRWDPGEKAAPGFVLRDENGRVSSLAALRGHPVLLTFLDSVCTRECPIEGRVLADVERRIARTDAVVTVVSVDPWSETPATVRRYARKARWTGGWHWFLGSAAALRPVWGSYHVGVRRVPGDVMHSAVLYLIDRHGDLRAGYLFPFAAGAVARDVRTVAGGGA